VEYRCRGQDCRILIAPLPPARPTGPGRSRPALGPPSRTLDRRAWVPAPSLIKSPGLHKYTAPSPACSFPTSSFSFPSCIPGSKSYSTRPIAAVVPHTPPPCPRLPTRSLITRPRTRPRERERGLAVLPTCLPFFLPLPLLPNFGPVLQPMAKSRRVLFVTDGGTPTVGALITPADYPHLAIQEFGRLGWVTVSSFPRHVSLSYCIQGCTLFSMEDSVTLRRLSIE
jgi:hypothetical protein